MGHVLKGSPLESMRSEVPPLSSLVLSGSPAESPLVLSKHDELASRFEGMMHHLFKEQGASLRIGIITEQPVQDFIDTHAQILDEAFSQTPMSDTMRSRLQQSDYIFSGIKTFHELNEAFPSLIDENGNRKPFEQFLNDVQTIDKTYNQNYLRAEYNFVQASAGMAAKWEQFQEDGDRYNLQYRTANDDKVRPEHAALDRVTLPPSDPFWRIYYPPNGWNCRCTVVQVRKSKYPETPHDEAMKLGGRATAKDKKGIFQFNPGIEQKTLPDYNPYTISRCRDCDLSRQRGQSEFAHNLPSAADKLRSDIAKGQGGITLALRGSASESHVPSGSTDGLSLAFVPDNELCAACKLIHQAQESRGKKKLTAQEFKGATTKAVQWADKHLPTVDINGTPSKRASIKTADGYDVKVGKKFFNETAAKNKKNPNLVHILKCATEFEKWLPTASRIRIEDGIDHDYKFSVYNVIYQGQVIECKCKLTSDEILYTMRIIQ